MNSLVRENILSGKTNVPQKITSIKSMSIHEISSIELNLKQYPEKKLSHTIIPKTPV